ncbi:unnamed protein product, partial [Closterium sp. Naga37s-1]
DEASSPPPLDFFHWLFGSSAKSTAGVVPEPYPKLDAASGSKPDPSFDAEPATEPSADPAAEPASASKS